ncbi:hypothetical protein ACH5AO_35695, partial [Streptomyces sp. NPDC018964]|uniref:hypothetical protein n=1 Tax=unclassified Streptomyces TaxID=2593676 RepID=UPI0037955C1D
DAPNTDKSRSTPQPVPASQAPRQSLPHERSESLEPEKEKHNRTTGVPDTGTREARNSAQADPGQRAEHRVTTREQPSDLIDPVSSAPEHTQVVEDLVRTDTREASTTGEAASDNAPSAVHSTDELLADIEDKFRPAVRRWNGPFVTEVERLTRILRVAGSRSLVFGITPDDPIWAVNDGGSIVWRAKDTMVLPAPQEAVGPVASIDIHRDGYLIGPAASAVQKGAVGFCDLNLGTDPYKILGGR